VTTWTTLGYGDLTVPASFRLLTSLEAITGSIATAVFISLLWLVIQESTVPPTDAYLDRHQFTFTRGGDINPYAGKRDAQVPKPK